MATQKKPYEPPAGKPWTSIDLILHAITLHWGAKTNEEALARLERLSVKAPKKNKSRVKRPGE